jgi:hypothetical protein
LAWGGCGLDSTGSGQGPVAGCCECGDEPSGSCATELVMPQRKQPVYITKINFLMLLLEVMPVYTENRMKPINTKCGGIYC